MTSHSREPFSAGAGLLAVVLSAAAQGPIAYRVSTYAGIPRVYDREVPASTLILNSPWGMARDGSGNVYVSESGNNVIRRIAPDGRSTVIAGTGRPGMSGDGGPAIAA